MEKKRYLRFTRDFEVEKGVPIFFFKKGKDYEVIKETEHDYVVINEFKNSHYVEKSFISSNIFTVIDTVPALVETINMTVWTNGQAIRKYVGQDKKKHTKDKKGWFKGNAVITIVKEEEIV